MADPLSAATPSLDQLRQLQLPEPVSWWPPAPGWWLLAAVTLAGLGWLGLMGWRRYQRRRYRRLALAELKPLQQQATTAPAQPWLQQLNQLLRRTALAAYSDYPVAALTGQRWSQFLSASLNKPTLDWSLLAESPYRADSELSPEQRRQLLQQTERWIRHHRPQPPQASRC